MDETEHAPPAAPTGAPTGAPTEGVPVSPPTETQRRRRGLGLLAARLFLMGTSFAVIFALCEIGTRILVAAPAPIRVRDGVYVTGLGKVNGFDTRTTYVGEPLATKKRPGELRIAVFGESTVQGSPWEAWGSPVTMLHDHLKDVMPERDVTVLNMGRGSGFTIDAYYFLVTLERFAPDYVIFYQGANDVYNADFEMCMPAKLPRAHRVWRFLVEHSRFLWTVRAQGPLYFASLKNKGKKTFAMPKQQPDRCDPVKGFKGWTDLLVETAQRMGAKVIVTTPVSNPLRWAERDGQFGIDRPLQLDNRDPHYRRLLGCLLTRGCDIGAAWKAETTVSLGEQLTLSLTRDPAALLDVGLDEQRYPSMVWLKPRVRASLAAAAEHGARSIDFHRYITEHLGGGLAPLIFVDEMHLTLDGLWLLSWFWTAEVANLIDGRVLPPLPPPFDAALRDRYLGDVVKDLQRPLGCIYFRTVPIFWRANMPLVGAVQLKLALESEAGAPGEVATTRGGLMAQLLSGWLRRRLGLPPGLPPSLLPLLAADADVDMQTISRELLERSDCSSLGAALLEPLLGPPATATRVTTDPPPPPPDMTPPPPLPDVIPPGAEGLIGHLLGDVAPAGCHLDGAQIQQTFIRATYKCPDGSLPVVDLRSPSDDTVPVAPSAPRTDRFVLVAGGPASPGAQALLDALAASLREREGPFQWKKPSKN